jgi:hypothetical protein
VPEGGTWLIVATVVNDPDYLTDEFVISSQFKKEIDLSKWTPRPCDIPPSDLQRAVDRTNGERLIPRLARAH